MARGGEPGKGAAHLREFGKFRVDTRDGGLRTAFDRLASALGRDPKSEQVSDLLERAPRA